MPLPLIITVIIVFVIIGIIAIYLSLEDENKKPAKILKDYKSSDFYIELNDLDIQNEKILSLKNEFSKYIVGSENLINSIIVSMLSNGHILVEGVPGLAKTKTILVLSKLLGLDFKRIQFTPDMLPADIIGGEIYDKKTGDFRIFKGPLFTNLLLADEINRTTPKVQSGLLEAMQEKKVTIGNKTFKLDEPFFVMATQNPIEQEGTFPLPEAQLDRFLFKVSVGYPSFEDEKEILDKFDIDIENIDSVFDKDELFFFQREIENIEVGENEKNYIVELVNSTRESSENIKIGASTRGVIYLKKAAMTVAYLQNKKFVEISDIKKVALLILRHRVNLSHIAISKGLTIEEVLINKFISIKDYKGV